MKRHGETQRHSCIHLIRSMQLVSRQSDRQAHRQTGRRNGHTVETGHNGGLTAITSIVIWTPDGGKTNPQKGEGGEQEEGRRREDRREDQTQNGKGEEERRKGVEKGRE